MTGVGAEEGPEAAYKREEELENARKGGEMDFDPEGILDEDDEMGICVEDKETQTGDLKNDVMDKATQATLKAVGKTSGTQTGRRLQRMSTKDPDMIKSGQHLPLERGERRRTLPLLLVALAGVRG